MNIPAVIFRPGCSAQAFAVRAWACCIEGTLSSTTASTSAPCTCGCKDGHLGSRWLSHLSHRRATSLAQPSASTAPLSRRALDSLPSLLRSGALPMSTSAAAAATAAASSSSASSSRAGHAQRERLEPAVDIPQEQVAQLADELGTPGSSSGGAGTGGASRGRRDRRPQRGAGDAGGLDDLAAVSVGSQAGPLGLPADDAEVQVVFDKIVGNLTKSGRKTTARRIVLDAVRIMRVQLLKGELDKIK